MTTTADAPTVVLSEREQAALIYHYPTSTAALDWFRLKVWSATFDSQVVRDKIARVEALIADLESQGVAREGDDEQS